jgi:hypothetical protein
MFEPDGCDTDKGQARSRVSVPAYSCDSEVRNTNLYNVALLVILRITVSKLHDHRPNQIRKLALDELVYSLIVRLLDNARTSEVVVVNFELVREKELTSSTRPSILKVHPGIPSPVWKLGRDGTVSPSATKESGR